MVQFLGKMGRRRGIYGGGESLEAAWKAKKGKNSSMGDVEACLARVSHMLQAIHLRRYIICANSKLQTVPLQPDW